MAPICPEEVDVFTIPHSRMKELVEQYIDLMTSTNFSNEVHLTKLLENLCKTFREFIAHEQIENRYIMKKLKNKLHSLSIQNNAVCNCHKDNQLTDMLNLLQDGYKCTKKSEADRKNYGIKLDQALQEFTKTFIPHMEEEEEVFQPLLMQYFTIEELKQIKAKVIEQHLKVEADETPEKCVHDNRSVKAAVKKTKPPCDTVSPFDMLPDEVIMKIFHGLNPKELSQASQVSTRWQRLSLDETLWTKLLPVRWAKGDWDAQEGVYEEDLEDSVDKKLEQKVMDEDADVDESHDNDSWNDTETIARQSKMLVAMCKYLLPKVGKSIKHCDLAYSKGLTNGTLYKILSLCPNLESLNLTQTHISDLGFKGLQKNGCGRKLSHVDLTGCLYITDKTLERLAAATTITHIKDNNNTDYNEQENNCCNIEQHATDKIDEENSTETHEEDNITDNQEQDEKGGKINREITKVVHSENDIKEQNDNCAIQNFKVPENDLNTTDCCKKTETCCMQEKVTESYMEKKVNETQSSETRFKTFETITPLDNITDSDNNEIPSHENIEKTVNDTDDCFESEIVICCEEARCCDMDNVLEKDLRVDDASSTCEEALSRLRCCQRMMRTGEYLSKKDTWNSVSMPKCCMKNRKFNSLSGKGNKVISANETHWHLQPSCTEPSNCCKNGYRNAGHDLQQEKVQSTNLNVQAQNENVNDNHSLLSSIKPPDICQQTCVQEQGRHDQRNSIEYNEDGHKINETNPLLHETEVNNDPKEDSFIDVDKDNRKTEEGDTNQTPTLLETTVEISPMIEQQNQLNTERGDSVVMTLIPELYIVPMEEIDCDTTGNDTQTVSLPENAPLTGYQPERDMNIDRAGNHLQKGRCLEFLCLSGCFKITDEGLQFLAEDGGLPNLRHLDLSGCLNLTGEAVSQLVSTAKNLTPARLFYCDNILDGPYTDTASGCQNLQCATRACCRVGE